MRDSAEALHHRLRSCELLVTEETIDGLSGKRRMYGFRAVSEAGEEAVWPGVDISRKAVRGLLSLFWEYDVLIEELPYVVEDYIARQYMMD